MAFSFQMPSQSWLLAVSWGRCRWKERNCWASDTPLLLGLSAVTLKQSKYLSAVLYELHLPAWLETKKVVPPAAFISVAVNSRLYFLLPKDEVPDLGQEMKSVESFKLINKAVRLNRTAWQNKKAWMFWKWDRRILKTFLLKQDQNGEGVFQTERMGFALVTTCFWANHLS